jgi:hypothetical protein
MINFYFQFIKLWISIKLINFNFTIIVKKGIKYLLYFN